MENLLQDLIDYLIKTVSVTFNYLFILLGPALILAFIMHSIARFLEKQCYRALGRKLFIYGFGLVGIPLHELGHALFCILFGHRIIELALFTPQGSQTLGHVSHTYRRDSLYQEIGNFFIGIGPVILGTVAIFFSARFLIGDQLFASYQDLAVESAAFTSLDGITALFQQVFQSSQEMLSMLSAPENFLTWQFYLFLYIVLSVGGNITLSRMDIDGAVRGFISFVILVFLFNLLTLWLGDFAARYVSLISQYYSFFYAVMIFSMTLNLLAALVLLPLALLRGRRG